MRWRVLVPRNRPTVIVAALFAGVVLLLVLWLIVSAIGTASASGRLRLLASPSASSDAAVEPGQTFDQLGARIADARSTLRRLKAFSTPFRLAPRLWGLSPVRGGDLRELPRLIAYGEATLDAASGLYELADGGRRAVSLTANGGAPNSGSAASASFGLQGAQAALEYADQNRGRLIEVRAAVERAGSIAGNIDRAWLSQGVADSLDRVEEVRGAVEAVLDLAVDLAPAIAEANAVARTVASPSDTSEVRLETFAAAAETFTARAAGLRGAARTLAPYAGRDPAGAEAAVDYGVRLARPLADLLGAAAEAADVAGGGLPRDQPSAARLDQALLSVERSALSASAVAVDEGRPEVVSEMLDAGSDQLKRIANAAAVARDLLGFNGRRRILVLGQDDEELRPGGGFIGSVWELEFDRGKLAASRVQSSYDVDERLPVEQWMRAPSGFALSFGAGVIPFRDQNWWPDFSYSAARLRETYERGQGTRPQVVVAVNQRSLEAFLDATGPVRIADGIAVDAGGLRLFLRDGIPAGTTTLTSPSDTDPRRYAAQLLGAGIIERLTGGGRLDLVRLSMGVYRAAVDGDLLIDIEAQPARAKLNDLGWDGALEAYQGDGWYWSDSNAYSQKISRSIIRSVHQRVAIQPDGAALDTLRVVYENPLTGAPSCIQSPDPATPPCYWFFGRLDLPAGTRITNAPRFDMPAGAVGAGRLLPGAASSLPREGNTTLRTELSAEGLELAALAVVPPGARREWEFEYLVPLAARTLAMGEWRYSSRIERQPGMPPFETSVEVVLPAKACITDVRGPVRGGPGSASATWHLTRDADLAVTYTFDASRCN